MKINDLSFVPFITREEIAAKVSALAHAINADYSGLTPVFVPVLNGSFLFAADLIRSIDIPCKVSFAKISSYLGKTVSGSSRSLIGLDESLFNQHVILVEDIVDTGATLTRLKGELRDLGARSVETAALLRKQPAREKNQEVKYLGFDIGLEFVLGYGLDYEGLGRNIDHILKAER